MKAIYKIIILFLATSVWCDNTQAQSMFRGTPDHSNHYNSGIKGFFNETSWKFYADAPVRSTVAVVNNSIYFGSSKGIFYCLNKNTGKAKWIFKPGYAINSSAAYHNSNVFFSDNQQSLYSLSSSSGKMNWKASLGTSKSYPWAFDYFYSSPTIVDGHILIGSKDGCVYNIDELTGRITWKFKTEGIVRSTPAIANDIVYVGDTEGNLFAIDLKNGVQKWRFEIEGHNLQNEKFGFDRRAIIAAPVIAGNKVIVGGRDGFLYAVDKITGKQVWRIDHEVSWVISAVAVKDNYVVTGTSDGHFVQAVDLNTGKELWKYHSINAVWSSPIIDGDKVYIGSHEGVLYCLDLKTGEKISGFQTGGIIFSSPVISGSLLYFGSDDGFLYALRSNGSNITSPRQAHKYVFWDADIHSGSDGNDVKMKKYLVVNGYKVLNRKELTAEINKTSAAPNSVIVFATNFFPGEITKGEARSSLRNYLGNGGKIVVMGNNPLILKLDSDGRSLVIRNFLYADSVLGIKYGPDDLRSYKGNQPAFPTKIGKEWGLQKFWASPLSIDPKQVDIVLGMDENGLASAWVKKYNPAAGSGFVQIWADASNPDLSFITRVAEYGLK